MGNSITMGYHRYHTCNPWILYLHCYGCSVCGYGYSVRNSDLQVTHTKPYSSLLNLCICCSSLFNLTNISTPVLISLHCLSLFFTSFPPSNIGPSHCHIALVGRLQCHFGGAVWSLHHPVCWGVQRNGGCCLGQPHKWLSFLNKYLYWGRSGWLELSVFFHFWTLIYYESICTQSSIYIFT